MGDRRRPAASDIVALSGAMGFCVRALFKIRLNLHLTGIDWAIWTDLEPVSELHPEVPSVLRDRMLEKLIPNGVRVAFVEQVVKADGSLQPAEHIFGKQSGVGDKEPSDERLL